MSDLDTTLDVDVAGIRALASWLRDGEADGVAAAAHALARAREDDGDWSGDAASAFRDRMRLVLATAYDSADALADAAAGLDRFADTLDRLRSRVGALRADAAAGGLMLTASAVLRPAAAGPPVPQVAPFAAPAQVAAHRHAVAARALAVSRDSAFDRAVADMQSVSAELEAAEIDLDRVTASVHTLLVPALDFVTGAGIGATFDRAVEAMRGRADRLIEDAQRAVGRTETPGAASFPRQFYDDLDRAGAAKAQAAGVSDDAARLARAGRAGGWVVGGALTGVSIYQDVQDGESTGQALASNAGGFAASVAAGAGVGFVIGTVVPGAGNVIGGVVGAVVGGAIGICASGMIDGWWESGGDLGQAFRNGWDDLVDTGAAIWDLEVQWLEFERDVAKSVISAPVDAWRSIFG